MTKCLPDRAAFMLPVVTAYEAPSHIRMKKKGLPFAKNEKNCHSDIAPEWQGQSYAHPK